MGVSFNILPVVKKILTLIVPMCFCIIFLRSYPFFTIGTPDNLCLLLNMCPAFFLFFHGTRRASLIVALVIADGVIITPTSVLKRDKNPRCDDQTLGHRGRVPKLLLSTQIYGKRP